MSAFNINTYYGCATCEAANEYGNMVASMVCYSLSCL